LTSIRIGTRGSALALAQCDWVKRRLAEREPGVKIATVVIKTSGDRFLDAPVAAVGGKGIFVKEIEEALLNNDIDIAVHSMKDLPAELEPGLTIAAVTEREDPRDALVSRSGRPLNELSPGTRIGTGSLRRRAQILHYRRDLEVTPIRGNIDTRLAKLDRGEIDAVIMAAAGLKRLGLETRIEEYLEAAVCLSAAAQGVLGLECRRGDSIVGKVAFLHDRWAQLEVDAERAFLRKLGGGCHLPIAARARVDGDRLRLSGLVADCDGKRLVRAELTADAAEAEVAGTRLADLLLEKGAGDILTGGGDVASATK
jgi:hydroxymethylbilane synthase